MGRTLKANSSTGEAREPIKPGSYKAVVVGFADIDRQATAGEYVAASRQARECEAKLDAIEYRLAELMREHRLERGVIRYRLDIYLVELTEDGDDVAITVLPDLLYARRPVPPEPPAIPGDGDCCRRRPPVPADASLDAIAAANSLEDLAMAIVGEDDQ